ncbi:hypothetical protein Bca101_076533 [Brassica carinata]
MCSPSRERPRVRVRAAAGGAPSSLPVFSFCSPTPLPLPFRYVHSSRSGLASPVEAPVARSLHMVEVAPSPDLRRGLGEGLFGSERFRYLRTVIKSAPGSSSFGGEVVYGYKGFPSCPPTPSSSLSRFLVQFTPCVGDGLLSGFSLALHCGIILRWLWGLFVSWSRNCFLVLKDCGCGDGSRESLVVSESASSPSSHPGSVVLVLPQSAVVLRTFLRRFAGWQKRALARLGTRFKRRVALLSSSFGGIARSCYSEDVKGNPGSRDNEENLTFPRITLMVENDYRYRRISKNKLAERAGFSGWAKLVL